MVSQKMIYLLAEATHEANRVIAQQILSEEKEPWGLISSATKAMYINAVRRTIDDKIKDPAVAHGNWLVDMEQQGWVYGEEYSKDNKTHPCMIPYAELPVGQQTKDEIYLSILMPFYHL